jgi:hypothetical protein
VPPIFFITVKRNRTTPIWQHTSLVPLTNDPEAESSTGLTAIASMSALLGDPINENEPEDARDEDEDEDDFVDTAADGWTGSGSTFREQCMEIETIRNFCDGLEYQLQFEDRRMLETVQREGSSFLRLARNCQRTL